MKWLTRIQNKRLELASPVDDSGSTIARQFIEAVQKTRKEEYVRMHLNYKIVNVLSYFNLCVLLPIALINWVLTLFGFFDFAFLNYLPWFVFNVFWFLPYFTWHYSTITIPKRNGKNIIGDYSKTAKGRYRSMFFNLIPFYVMGWSAAAKWVYDHYLDYLLSIRLDAPYNNLLITDDLNSLIFIAFVAPVIFTGVIVFIQIRDYLINKDLLEEHFQTWESPFLRKFAHEYQMDSCDVIVGFEIDTKKPIVIKEDARFLHEAIIGATGSGKTSTTLLLRIAQDLIKYASGARENGLVFLEPKGDGVDDVLTLCKKLGIPDDEITVIDPTKTWTKKYNPFFGDRATAASDFTGTLSALAQDQDQFFKDQQNEAATMYSLLAKIRFENATNITHIEQIFSDARYLADTVEAVRAMVDRNMERDDLTKAMRLELESYDRIVSYFENQVLEYKTFREKEDIRPVLYPAGHKYAGKQMVENKKEKFITGAKKYLNDIAQNPLLLSLFVSENDEDPFNADEFLTKGGIVLVNTALGELDELSLMFGQFFIRNFQSAVFRRAKEDKANNVKRIPIFFYVDEFPLYANEAFERFLTLGRSYKVGSIIAMQSIAQLEAVGLSYRKSVMGNASHKTVFGRGPVEDNEYFSKEFGEMLVVEESMNESGTPMTNESQTWGYRLNTQKKLAPRFTPTDIRELPFKQMIVQVVNEQNSIAKPKKAVGQFVHESPFVQRFMKLVESDIKSTEEKELYIEQQIGDSFSRLASNVSNQKSLYDPTADNEHDLIARTLEHSPEVASTLSTLPAHENVIVADEPSAETYPDNVVPLPIKQSTPVEPVAQRPIEQPIEKPKEDEWFSLFEEKPENNHVTLPGIDDVAPLPPIEPSAEVSIVVEAEHTASNDDTFTMPGIDDVPPHNDVPTFDMPSVESPVLEGAAPSVEPFNAPGLDNFTSLSEVPILDIEASTDAAPVFDEVVSAEVDETVTMPTFDEPLLPTVEEFNEAVQEPVLNTVSEQDTALYEVPTFAVDTESYTASQPPQQVNALISSITQEIQDNAPVQETVQESVKASEPVQLKKDVIPSPETPKENGRQRPITKRKPKSEITKIEPDVEIDDI